MTSRGNPPNWNIPNGLFMDRSATNTASWLKHMTKDTQLLKAAAVVLNTVSSSNSKIKKKKRHTCTPIYCQRPKARNRVFILMVLLLNHEMCMLWRRHATRKRYWQLANIQMWRMWIKR